MQASDRGNPPKRATTTVFIEILDVNDNSPVMEKSFYEISVHENATVGAALMQLAAWDYDIGMNFLYQRISEQRFDSWIYN